MAREFSEWGDGRGCHQECVGVETTAGSVDLIFLEMESSRSMDLFSSNFNAEKILNDLQVPSTRLNNFESIDEFEQYLWHTNAALVTQLQRLEVQESAEKKPSTGPSRRFTQQTSFEELNITLRYILSAMISAYQIDMTSERTDFRRETRLSQMCARRGRNVTEPVKQLNLNKTDQQGPMRRLKECMEQGHTVCISLRGRNSVNSFIQAKIVAFDKHWNLLIRDGDESFKPPVRMKLRATKSMQITRSTESECEDREIKTKTLWRRYLPCSLIRGDNVVLIFVSPRLSFERFLQIMPTNEWFTVI
ncbi:unnamed protein product [Onchocerca ochengi]|uniref:Sm domain-containing protein n=1 Tax=Onchocerca ochengi TaxID=42157 RepID=A0A182DWY4_ONCOC|nr:unnamed protein product [Onchocerca ochengi]